MSANATHQRTQVAHRSRVATGGRLTPGALELGLLAVVAIVVVDASILVAVDRDPLGAAFKAAHSLLGAASWPMGSILLATAIGLVHRAAAAPAVPDSAPDDGLALDPAAGDATLLALENARLESELRASNDQLRLSSARIATAAAAERRRLERELHDRAQNRLVGLQIRLRLAHDRAEESAPEVATMLAACGEQAEAVNRQRRRAWSCVASPTVSRRQCSPRASSLRR